MSEIRFFMQDGPQLVKSVFRVNFQPVMEKRLQVLLCSCEIPTLVPPCDILKPSVTVCSSCDKSSGNGLGSEYFLKTGDS